jgi:hypothetical protein
MDNCHSNKTIDEPFLSDGIIGRRLYTFEFEDTGKRLRTDTLVRSLVLSGLLEKLQIHNKEITVQVLIPLWRVDPVEMTITGLHPNVLVDGQLRLCPDCFHMGHSHIQLLYFFDELQRRSQILKRHACLEVHVNEIEVPVLMLLTKSYELTRTKLRLFDHVGVSVMTETEIVSIHGLYAEMGDNLNFVSNWLLLRGSDLLPFLNQWDIDYMASDDWLSYEDRHLRMQFEKALPAVKDAYLKTRANEQEFWGKVGVSTTAIPDYFPSSVIEGIATGNIEIRKQKTDIESEIGMFPLSLNIDYPMRDSGSMDPDYSDVPRSALDEKTSSGRTRKSFLEGEDEDRNLRHLYPILPTEITLLAIYRRCLSIMWLMSYWMQGHTMDYSKFQTKASLPKDSPGQMLVNELYEPVYTDSEMLATYVFPLHVFDEPKIAVSLALPNKLGPVAPFQLDSLVYSIPLFLGLDMGHAEDVLVEEQVATIRQLTLMHGDKMIALDKVYPDWRQEFFKQKDRPSGVLFLRLYGEIMMRLDQWQLTKDGGRRLMKPRDINSRRVLLMPPPLLRSRMTSDDDHRSLLFFVPISREIGEWSVLNGGEWTFVQKTPLGNLEQIVDKQPDRPVKLEFAGSRVTCLQGSYGAVTASSKYARELDPVDSLDGILTSCCEYYASVLGALLIQEHDEEERIGSRELWTMHLKWASLQGKVAPVSAMLVRIMTRSVADTNYYETTDNSDVINATLSTIPEVCDYAVPRLARDFGLTNWRSWGWQNACIWTKCMNHAWLGCIDLAVLAARPDFVPLETGLNVTEALSIPHAARETWAMAFMRFQGVTSLTSPTESKLLLNLMLKHQDLIADLSRGIPLMDDMFVEFTQYVLNVYFYKWSKKAMATYMTTFYQHVTGRSGRLQKSPSISFQMEDKLFPVNFRIVNL